MKKIIILSILLSISLLADITLSKKEEKTGKLKQLLEKRSHMYH